VRKYVTESETESENSSQTRPNLLLLLKLAQSRRVDDRALNLGGRQARANRSDHHPEGDGQELVNAVKMRWHREKMRKWRMKVKRLRVWRVEDEVDIEVDSGERTRENCWGTGVREENKDRNKRKQEGTKTKIIGDGKTEEWAHECMEWPGGDRGLDVREPLE
jgi:hypothetical protein